MTQEVLPGIQEVGKQKSRVTLQNQWNGEKTKL